MGIPLGVCALVGLSFLLRRFRITVNRRSNPAPRSDAATAETVDGSVVPKIGSVRSRHELEGESHKPELEARERRAELEANEKEIQ